jgi:hypothetical protein
MWSRRYRAAADKPLKPRNIEICTPRDLRQRLFSGIAAFDDLFAVIVAQLSLAAVTPFASDALAAFL